jgi:lipopolysaccharide/colanic/teichoic acid biosynthesis glycosyltransferase
MIERVILQKKCAGLWQDVSTTKNGTDVTQSIMTIIMVLIVLMVLIPLMVLIAPLMLLKYFKVA